MVILDTNHITALERRGKDAERLLERLSEVPTIEIAVTIISYEEQVRGWMAVIAQEKDIEGQVRLYQRLQAQMENYCSLNVLSFDPPCVEIFRQLRRDHRRTGTPDLKIAAIAIVHKATLLTRNARDFGPIEGLRSADWTAEIVEENHFGI